MAEHQSDEPLIPELRERQRQFEAAKQQLRQLATGLTDEQFNWRPEPGRWSIAQCVDHLRVTGAQVLPRIDQGIAHARARQWFSPGPFRYGFLGDWFVRANGATERPPRRGFKAPGLYAPSAEQPLSRMIPAFVQLQDDLISRVRNANGLDLAPVKVNSPVSRWIRLSLGQWFALVAAHQERHLGQAARVRQAVGSPMTHNPL